MLAPIAIAAPSPLHGLGLFATRAIPKGTIVYHPCPHCRVVAAEPMSQEERQTLESYGFTLVDGRLFVSCGDSRFLNHSCQASVLDFGLDFLIAVRDIAEGEELSQDYRTFISDSTGSWRLQCKCGAPQCAGVVEPTSELPEDLLFEWSARLREALRAAPAVTQPLAGTLARYSASYHLVANGAPPELILAAARTIRAPLHLFEAP